MYENNDKVLFTDAELEEIRDLYRMKRNHIYDITAQIDRRGGGLDLKTYVHEWYDGGSMDINYADNYAGDLNVITQTPVTTEDGEAYAVVYGDNDKMATFTFRMTLPVAGTWTANTELYITVTTVNGERMGEQIINPDSKNYPGTTTSIKIRQVSLDQWNEYNNN